MSYKRQLWTSGYEYHIRCPYCGTNFKYSDKQLGYRSWYPNGFVYCTKCRKPLRHNEIYAVNPDGTPVYSSLEEANQAINIGYLRATGHPVPVATPKTAKADNPSANVTSDVAYCPECGRKYIKGADKFCSGCGKKLD